MRMLFTCEKCEQTLPARNVAIGPAGAQWCNACATDGELPNDLDVLLRCTRCGQRGHVPVKLHEEMKRRGATCSCGAAFEEQQP